jgi:iron complex outermembrane receptor protein
MENIDYIFENPFLGVEILPGLKEYREKYNKGSLVFDTRIAYEFSEKLRLGFMVNNVLNAEYTSRPGDIQAPRTFLIQVQAKF